MEAGYDLGQKENYVYMLLPFIKIESFLQNSTFQEEEDELHDKICKYFLKMMKDMYQKLDVEAHREEA